MTVAPVALRPPAGDLRSAAARTPSLPDVVTALSPDPTRTPRLALVSMPFATAAKPSMQLGLLGACASACGIDVDCVHAHVELAAVLGTAPYEAICAARRLVGEWLFARAAFGARMPRADIAGFEGADLDRVRDDVVPAFLDHLLASRDWARYDVVGFSSMFQQNVASLALAGRLKERHPGLQVVFGGANCDGPMGRELLRSFPAVDHVVSGYADVTLPALVRTIAAGRPAADVPGVRSAGSTRPVEPAPALDSLDMLPTPDHGPYFVALAAAGLLPPGRRRTVPIPFESSRGCWWGERRHCTFCGLNGEEMAFRSKSPARLADELYGLVRATGSYHLEAVDNILDEGYVTTVLPRIAAESDGLTLFYEVKSSLRPDQLRAMSAAGVRRVQPGIESLSSRVLGLMRKGVTAAQNVHFLVACRHLGIRVDWNILWGFPGEREDDYRSQAELLRHLAHLEPPQSAGPLWLERYSPLYREQAADQEASGLRPRQDYSAVYPADVDLHELAYFFESDVTTGVPERTYDALAQGVDAWRRLWESGEPPRFTMWRAPGIIHLEDTRDPAGPRTHVFDGQAARLIDACATPTTAPRAARALGAEGLSDDVAAALKALAEAGVLFQDGPRFVSLAVPARARLAGDTAEENV